MAITQSEQKGQGGVLYKYETITEADTPAEQQIEAGRYTVTAYGTWGGGSIELQYSKVTGANFHSIDSTNLNFSADGSYNIEIGRGFVKPVRTGGSSMDVDVVLTPIPRS